MQKKFLESGKIVNTHGVTGEIKVQPWCDAPDVLTQFDTLYWSDGAPVHVKSASVHKNCVLLRLDGVNTIEQAEALRDKILYLSRDDVELPEDLVFIQDILTFEVYDERLERVIGHIQDVLTSNPAQDLYEISGTNGKAIYIPAVKPFLQRIDMDARRIYLRSIEGLFDEN